MKGVELPGDVYVGICGTDIVRDHDGFKVLEDNLRVPSGVSYMLANRHVVKSNFRSVFRQYQVLGIEHYGALLRRTLGELAPEAADDPASSCCPPACSTRRSTSMSSLPGRWESISCRGATC